MKQIYRQLNTLYQRAWFAGKVYGKHCFTPVALLANATLPEQHTKKGKELNRFVATKPLLCAISFVFCMSYTPVSGGNPVQSGGVEVAQLAGSAQQPDASCLTTQPNRAEGISFLTGDWGKAQEVAAYVKTPIFTYVFMPGSQPCRAMQLSVLNNKEIGELYNSKFISYKVNVNSPEGMQFKNKYKIESYPALLYFYPNGALINSAQGYKTAEEMKLLCKQTYILLNCSAQSAEAFAIPVSNTHNGNNGIMQQVANVEINGIKKLTEYKLQYENGNRNSQFLSEYAYILKKFGIPSGHVANQYLATISADKKTIEENMQFVLDFAVEANSDAFDLLLTYQKTYADLIGEQRVAQTLLNAMRATVNKAASLQDFTEYNMVMSILNQWDNPLAPAYRFELNELYYRIQNKWEDYSSLMLDNLNKPPFTNPDMLNSAAQNFALHIHDKHKLERALQWVKSAINQKPDRYIYYQTYAALYYRLGNPKKALQLCGSAARLAQKTPEADYTPVLILEDYIRANKPLPKNIFEN